MAAPRVVVLSPWQPDQILTLSTLPALTRALVAQGADARLHGRWDFDWQEGDLSAPRPLTRAQTVWRTLVRLLPGTTDPYGTYAPPDGLYGHPLRWSEPESRRAQLDDAFWSSLDLSTTDVVVAPGWTTARRALEHPTRRAGCRVIAADFHMLEGCVPWARERAGDGVRISTGAWWPGDDLVVHACFPSFAKLYENAGVPLRSVRWMPYPLYVPHHAGARDVSSASFAFAGGRHDRDWSTLTAAGDRLTDLSRPIRVHAPRDAVPARAPFDPRGEVNVADFSDAIRHSRFVIVPLHGDDATRAAGISVAALAIAAGRPVIATDTPAMRDTVTDGVDAVLVPARDPRALADAIHALDADPARLAALAKGAVHAAHQMDTTAWATRVIREARAGG